MRRGRLVQRNPYKGDPPRPWVRLRLVSAHGPFVDVELLADTGNPFAIIVSPEAMKIVKQEEGPDLPTNFGILEGGWVKFTIPELDFVEEVMAFASQAAAKAARASSADFDGLVGLPLLRLLQYGGDADSFWIMRRKTK